MRSPHRNIAVLSTAGIAASLALAACGSSSKPAASLAGVGALPAPASAWPEASFDARRDSGTTATGPLTDTVKWQRNLGSPLIAGPVIGADGSVIEATSAGIVHALDPATGADRWITDIGQPGGSDLSSSPAVLTGGIILVPGAAGSLVALSEGGSILWKLPLGSGQVLSPAVAGAGRVYVIGMSGEVMALKPDAAGPHPQWTLNIGAGSYGSPAVAPDGTILTTLGKDLIAIADRGASGGIRWKFAAKADVEVSPAVTPAGLAILGTNGDDEYAVKPDGSLAWKYAKKQWSYSSPVATPKGSVVFGDNDGRLYSVGATSGAGSVLVGPTPPTQARDSKGVGVWTAPVVDASGDLYAGTASGLILGYDPKGLSLFDLDTGSTVDGYPALGDGVLYAGSNSGVLYAIG